ncbi:MAG: thioesterase domain-containing protein, partial [Ruminiclostridium sp.]
LYYIREKGINTDDLSIKQIFTSGEALQAEQVQLFFSLFKNVNLANLYGPTEATIDVSYYDCGREPYGNSIPIGKPIDNINLYILGENNSLLSIGIPGELCIGGVGLARGYLNNQELTNKKFVENPFCSGEKMYQTGDLAKWLPDGNIEFLGRMDHQVKIRGYRIELGEIEKKLLKYKGITSAIVTTKDDREGSKYLCAYVVAKDKLVTQGLRDYLLEQLPEYMVPQSFYQIERIPLSNNGKINTKALLEIEQLMPTGTKYIPPQNKIQEKIAEVWSKVLNVKRVSINDNYFELGGDSIKAIKIIYELEKMGFILTIEDIIKYKTVNKLSEKIEYNKFDISQDPVVGEIKFSPVQKFYFNKENIMNMNHFNQSVLIYYRDGFDESRIKQAFNKIINHHDIFRLVCRVHNDQLNQYILPIVDDSFVDLKIINLCDVEDLNRVIESECNKIQVSIDLNYGPLIKLGLFKTDCGDHLLIVVNHLIIDSVSWGILKEDFLNLYMATDNNVELPAKTHSYRDWVDRLYDYAQKGISSDEKEYWLSVSRTVIKPLRVDNIIDSRKNMYSRECSISLSKEETSMLKSFVSNGYTKGIDMILLFAISNAINVWNNSDKTLIAYESHGRNHTFRDVNITRTIGWFTSIYPVILDYKDMVSLDILKSFDKNLKDITNNGHAYGSLKYLSQVLDECITEPEIAFNYVGDINEIKNEKFILSDLPKGAEAGDETLSKYKLFISSKLENDKVQIDIMFNNKEYDTNTINILAELFIKSIRNITDLQKKNINIIKKDKENTFIWLSNTRKTNKMKIMLFPPHMIRIAYEAIYRNLITYMEDYDMYMFTIQNSKNIISDYVDDIIDIQEDNPYILMGYSAGGNLAYHVAMELEKRGRKVSDIIMIDVPKWEKSSFRELEQDTLVSELLDIIVKYNEDSTVDLSIDTIDKYLKQENVIKEMVYYNEYYKYYNESNFDQKRIYANIHLLYGDLIKQNYYKHDTRFYWRNITENGFYTYKAEGDHFSLFSKTNIGKNAKIICNILNDCTKQKNEYI